MVLVLYISELLLDLGLLIRRHPQPHVPLGPQLLIFP
jgi:hypothetical protein